MKKIIQILSLLLLISAAQILYGQSKKEQALEKGQQALKLEDEGNLDDAIKLLEEAQKLAPGDILYPYELAYAYYAKEDYKKASKYLEGILKHKDVHCLVYELLGNCYDNLGNSDKAVETYKAGLKKFPDSGELYLEMGVMKVFTKDFNKALSYFEKGIEVDPKFPSNYFWAAKIYCNSSESVWGMIYGEIFMNLERSGKRTEEISKLLFDTYKSQITFTNDTSMTVSFSKNATINLDDLKDPSKFKLPFGVGLYEPTILMSIINEKKIDINSLDRIRKNFVTEYFKNGNDKKYPNVLFDYQNKVLEAGHIEAYNHWILMKGDEDGFDEWQKGNTEKYDSFIKWFTDNGLQLDRKNRFYREQY